MCVDHTTEVFASASCGLASLRTPAVRCACSLLLGEHRAPSAFGSLLPSSRAALMRLGRAVGSAGGCEHRARRATTCLCPHTHRVLALPSPWVLVQQQYLWCDLLNSSARFYSLRALYTNHLIRKQNKTKKHTRDLTLLGDIGRFFFALLFFFCNILLKGRADH